MDADKRKFFPGWISQEGRQAWNILLLSIRKFLKIDGTTWAGAFAFTMFLSLLPLMFLLNLLVTNCAWGMAVYNWWRIPLKSLALPGTTSGALFVVYLKKFARLNAIYGAFCGIISLLIWFFISGCIFIFGDCMCAANSQITYKQKELK